MKGQIVASRSICSSPGIPSRVVYFKIGIRFSFCQVNVKSPNNKMWLFTWYLNISFYEFIGHEFWILLLCMCCVYIRFCPLRQMMNKFQFTEGPISVLPLIKFDISTVCFSCLSNQFYFLLCLNFDHFKEHWGK